MNGLSSLFIDEFKYLHKIGEKLGQGGQGIVHRTHDPDLAIKLITDSVGNLLTDKQHFEKYENRFKAVRHLPLPENIHIAIPVALVDKCEDGTAIIGYVMQLLSEMRPFSDFWFTNKSEVNIQEIPHWLSGMEEKNAKEFVHYYNSGGLRRRLIALYKCSSILARLHSNGLIYGDISPNNIFISEDKDYSEVWFIDADNIRFELPTGGSVVFTPRYGAPELVQGKASNTQASDCYSFAILAFYLLSMLHPFEGKKVDGSNDESDWADEDTQEVNYEEQANAGKLPWVDDAKDDSNSSKSGLTRSDILTQQLSLLFEATFCKKGRELPSSRPAIYHWVEALAQAADKTIVCPSCKMSYFYDNINPENGELCCPYCRSPRPQILLLKAYQWRGLNTTLDTVCWYYTREISIDSEVVIPRRVFTDFSMQDSDQAEIIISLNMEGILVKKSIFCEQNLSVLTGENLHQFHSQFNLKQTDFWLVINSSDTRVISCSICRGTQCD